MGKKLTHAVGPVLGLVLFSLALWVIHRELGQYHYHDIARAVRSIPPASFALACLLTVLNYVTLIIYDILGLRYIRHPLSWLKIALVSFIAYAFSNNVGFYSLSGSAIRYRLYSAWGLATVDITRVIAFSSILTFWLGLAAICAFVFIVEPVPVPAAFHLPFVSVRFIGIAFAAALAVFLLWTMLRKKPVSIKGWEFEIPSTGLSLSLISTACLDWMLCGAVLYVLLPDQQGMSFMGFLGIFLLSMLAGLISHVPGGLGLFETAIILFLPRAPAASVLGALLVFRAVYYLLPLCVSALLMGSYELLQRRKGLTSLVLVLQQWGIGIAPYVFAALTFLAGAVLQISGAVPLKNKGHAWIILLTPLPVFEVSHLLASTIGVALLILAWGVYHRLDAAYHLVLYLFGAGILFSLFKGAQFEQAFMLAVALALLLPCRRSFYRKTSFFSERFTAGWTVAIGLVIIASIWIGIFSYKHVAYSHELWWQFSFDNHASRFLRASVGGGAVILAFALLRLFGPGRPRTVAPGENDLEKAHAILDTAARVYGRLALLGDKTFLFNEGNDAFIMYGVQGRSWVALGDPVGRPDAASGLVWRFRELCDRYNGSPVFYEVGRDNLHLYLDLGLALLKIGEEGRVDLCSFSLDGGAKKNLRHIVHKVEQEGCFFEVVSPEQVPEILDRLRVISDAWLAEKKTREKRFSLGFFSEQYIRQCPVAVVKRAGEILAFSNILSSAAREELSIDLMRYIPSAPAGIMDYLFINLQQWGKAGGYQWFSLGMAPLSGMEDRALAPVWMKVGAFLFRHGENFYNFQGLRLYKEKFHPVWEPKYLAAPRGFSLPLILKDISSLIAGGVKGVFAK